MKKRFLFSNRTIMFAILFFSSLFFINNSVLKASDLTTKEIIVPGQTVVCSEPFKPKFTICNINIYDALASEWNVEVTIKDSDANTVFSETVSGVLLQANTGCITLETTGTFTPNVSNTYTITVDVDYVYDINASNDLKTQNFIVDCIPPNPPDMELKDILVPNDSLEFGKTTTTKPEVMVFNLGDNDVLANEWDVTITVKDATNTTIFSEIVLGVDVASGNCVSIETVNPFPPILSGNYTLFATVTYSSDENSQNDMKTKEFVVKPPLPADLTVESITTPNQAVNCDPFKPKFVINNLGDLYVDAGEWNVDVSIKKSGVTSNSFSETITGVLIGGGNSVTIETTNSFSPEEEGDYTLEVTITYSGDANANNNQLIQEFVVSNCPKPDIEVKSISVPTQNMECDIPFKPKFEICNKDSYSVGAGEWATYVYIINARNDTLFTELISGVNLESLSCVTLETDNSFTPSYDGPYTIFVRADFVLEGVMGNNVDVDLSNNLLTQEFATECPKPDLTIQSISVPDSTMVCDKPFKPKFEVCNIGDAAAKAGWVVDVLIEDNLTPVFTETIENTSILEPGACIIIETDSSFTPEASKEYLFYAGIDIDYDNNFENNDITKNFITTCIEKELKIKSVIVPDSVVECNTKFLPKYEICNDGTNSVDAFDWSFVVTLYDSTVTVLSSDTLSGTFIDGNSCIIIEASDSISLSEGEYFLHTLLIEPSNTIIYDDEETIFKSACPKPDLTVQSISVPDSTMECELPFNPKFEICNIGNATAKAGWIVDIYIFNEDSTDTFSEIIPNGIQLEPGECVTLETDSTFNPGGLETYTISTVVHIDGDGNTENDLKEKRFEVDNNCVETYLELKRIIVPDSTMECNIPFKPKFEVFNHDNVAVSAAEWSYVVVVLADSGNGLEKHLEKTYPGILIGPSTSVIIELADSLSLPESDAYIGIDIIFDAAENDGDNLEFSVVCPKPDLTVQSISVPDSTMECELPFNPKFEICNIGNATAKAGWSADIGIFNEDSTDTFYESIPNGIQLEPGECVTLETNNSWDPMEFETYVITVTAIIEGDGNTDNDWRDKSFEVTCEPVSVKISENRPDNFELYQSYPNPFNPSSQIEFDVLEESEVKLYVYNMLGQVVAILVDEVKSAGSYRINFDASNLPTGVYIYRIKMGNYQKTMKMILTK